MSIGLPPEPGEEELLPHGSRRVGRRLGIFAAVAVLALVVGAIVRFTDDSGNKHVAAAPSHTVTPTPSAAPSPMPPPTDLLIPGNMGTYWSVGDHRAVFSADLWNIWQHTLRVDGPILLLGPDGSPVPHATADLAASGSLNPSREPAVTTIGRARHAWLRITVHFDCTRDGAELRWPSRYPTIVINLVGFGRPWTSGFYDLFNEHYLRSACQSAGGTG